MARLLTPRGHVPSRRRRDVHRHLRARSQPRERVGHPTRTLIGFLVCFLASLVVVIVSTVLGQPQDYTAPLLNQTDQLVVVQYDPDTTVTPGPQRNPDPVVRWDVDFEPDSAEPVVTLSWGGYDRFGPIYLFMADTLADALQLPCPGLQPAGAVPDPVVTMVAGIDNADPGTDRLQRAFTSESGGATCALRPGYATSSNEPYVNVVTPNTIIARSQQTAPVSGATDAKRQMRTTDVLVRAETYPTDFRLDAIQASTNASEFNNGRLEWNTSDLDTTNAGQLQATYTASFEQLEIKFLSTQQEINAGRQSFYAAIFLGLGLGVAAECMFRLLMDEHHHGDFWSRGPRTRPRKRNLLNLAVDGVRSRFRRGRDGAR